MGIGLGVNSYGKAEIRVVRVLRDGERHEIRDLNVTTSLHGHFVDAHVRGDQSNVLPTDSQKNTVYVLAQELAGGPPELFALTLARHFVDNIGPVEGARVTIEEYPWERVSVDGRPHAHTFVRRGGGNRTTTVTVEGSGENQRAWVVSGVTDLVLLKSTGSEFRGFLVDEYTTLAPAIDRVMATSLVARWRYADSVGDTHTSEEFDWDGIWNGVREVMLAQYAQVHSFALQHTLWEMGKGVLDGQPSVVELRLEAPNKHHFIVDLAPFKRSNPGEVFYAADRPYGLIKAAVERDDVPRAELAWDAWPPVDRGPG